MTNLWAGTAVAAILFGSTCIGLSLGFLLAVLLPETEEKDRDADEDSAQGVWVIPKREGTS